MRTVEFLAPAQVGTLYNPGEFATFPEDVADALVKAGLAREVKPKKPAGDQKPAE